MRNINSSRLRGTVLYEFKMRLRSWMYWIIFVVSVAIALFVPTPLNFPGPEDAPCFALDRWRAGRAFGPVSVFMTLLAIFVVADRIVRDQNLRVKELIQARPIRETEYVLGKYLGTFLALTLIPVTVFIATPIAKYLMLGSGMDLFPLMLAVGLYLLPVTTTTAIALAGATLIKSPRAFYAVYAVSWYLGNQAFFQVRSPLQAIIDIRGYVPFQAFFTSEITCMGEPSLIGVELVVMNAIAIFMTAAILLAALTYLEKRRRHA